jgi:hypothetical protein
MGRQRLYGIAITGFSLTVTMELQMYAKGIFGKRRVSSIVKSNTNNYFSFFVGPQGSKMDSVELDEDGRKKEKFYNFMTRMEISGGHYFKYCEFFYGDDRIDAQIEDSN